MERSAGLIGIVGAIGGALLAHAQELRSPRLKVEDIVGNPALLGQTVECAGVVDRVEKDGLSVTTFFVVLEGNLYCRLLLEPMRAGKRKVDFKKMGPTTVGLYIDGTRVFAPGEEVVVRGRVSQEMKRTVLDRSTLREASNPHVRSVLGLSGISPGPFGE